MINRRDSLKLAAAGFLIPSASAFANQEAPVGSPVATPEVSQPTSGSWPMVGGNPARSGVMPGPIPSIEQPIIVRWRYEPEDDWLRSDEPVVANGILYLRGENNIYAINVDSGLEYWRYDLQNTRYISLADGVVYAATSNSALHAINADTGLEIWRYNEGVDDGTPTPSNSEFSSPAVVDGIATVVGNEAIQALDASTGDALWSFPTEGWSYPAVVAGGAVLGQSNEGVFALDLVTGVERWRSTIAFVILSVVGEIVLAGGDDYLSGLSLETGHELWRFSLHGQGASTFGLSESQFFIIVFTENEYGYYRAEVQAIDIESGGLFWMYSLGEISNAWSSNMRVVGDQMFVKLGDPDNQLIIIDITTGLKTWEYRGYITDVYPVAVDQNLYFVHAGELFAIGNLLDPVLIANVTLRAAPSEFGLERGTASSGDLIDHVGARSESNGELWVEISVGGVTGWVPASAIDPATLPPAGDVWVIYDPAWF